ncbi:hypothetical protein GTY65_15685 [Streptomyces sp. SID8379]|uniref:hypothetical protein n=1 Tax=unclassified Streptomyces TaxID=2593676 RepID=UPI00036812E8|nr:hypothetical protein [Streptomyces sp. HmicA12]MYW65489.1 hypothetical protein [Streptomyces sp. SID8379]
MTRTTPPRPLDPEALFPGIEAHRRTCTRLHPRPGTPTVAESSVGGPLLWPAGEPWPVCTAPHRKGRGYLLADVRAGDGARRGKHAPWIADEDPVPLLAAAQLYARDVPDLPAGPDGCDLLQVLWCPFEAHGPDRTVEVVLRWRRAADVVDPLPGDGLPAPEVVGREACVPRPCVLDPERIVEYEYADLLPRKLRKAVHAWEDSQTGREEAWAEGEPDYRDFASYEEYQAAAAAYPEQPEILSYWHHLSIAPGWKVGGYASWHLTDPARVDCGSCGTPMRPLLTVDAGEWDGITTWVPHEDRESIGVPGAATPTGVHLGRDEMRVFTCPANPAHPHRLSFQ